MRILHTIYFGKLGEYMQNGTKEKEELTCHGCVQGSHLYNVGMMAIRSEVRITCFDYKSPNGHSFHGNEDCYKVSKELAVKIEPERSKAISIFSFYSDKNSQGLRLIL